MNTIYIAPIVLVEFLGILLSIICILCFEERETEKYCFILPFAMVNVFFFVFQILKALCV